MSFLFLAVLIVFGVLFYGFGGVPCAVLWTVFWGIALGVLVLMDVSQ